MVEELRTPRHPSEIEWGGRLRRGGGGGVALPGAGGGAGGGGGGGRAGGAGARGVGRAGDRRSPGLGRAARGGEEHRHADRPPARLLLRGDAGQVPFGDVV